MRQQSAKEVIVKVERLLVFIVGIVLAAFRIEEHLRHDETRRLFIAGSPRQVSVPTPG